MLNKKISMLLAVIMIVAFASSTITAQEGEKQYDYVGVKMCGMCHKKAEDGAQLKKWEEGPHSKAYETLKSEESNKIAKEMGYDKPAVEVDDCLKCHVTGHDADEERFGSMFKIEQGVQCEGCHGPGSEYKKMSIMKDHAKAVAAGMREFKNDEDIKELCLECHNEESPTYKGFNFEEQYPKVAHPIPSEDK
jgi:cytochrome c553